MSSSNQSPAARAKARTPQLDRMLDAERNKLFAIVQEHETQIDYLKQSFKASQDALILNVEDALIGSYKNRDEIERRLQEEQQRVVELTKELDEITVNLASEKLSHGLIKIALNKSKSELDEAKRQVTDRAEALEATEQHISSLREERAELLTTLGAVDKLKDQVRAELEMSKSESAETEKRLKAANQRNVDLEADLKAATERASAAEKDLEVFKSRFKRITEDITALASSSKQQLILSHPMAPALASEGQPIVAQPISSTPTQAEEDSMGHRESRPQADDSPARPQDLVPHLSNRISSKESDLLHCKGVLDQVMDRENWDFNRYFLKSMDSLTLASRAAKVGPMKLDIIKEKLAGGAYDSVTSFKSDFDSIIADAKRLNNPFNHVRIAAERLSKTFDQAFSSRPGHEPRETARSAQDTNGKRKAGSDALDSPEDEPVQKRRSLAPAEQSTEPVQRAISGARASLTPASTASGQSKDATQDPELANADHVKGQTTTGPRLDIDAKLSAVAQLVSYTKSPSTITGDWKSLVPDNYRITAHARPNKVEYCIGRDMRFYSRDMIILRLLPATGADKPEFNRLLEYLILRDKFATVSHSGIDNVDRIYLIPVSKKAVYPRFLLGLDHALLPPAKTEDILFVAILFKVAVNKQSEVRDAWDGRMKAIQQHGARGLISLRDAIVCNPLHICRDRTMTLSRAKRDLRRIRDLPYSENLASPELRVYGEDLLRLSYSKWRPGQRPSIYGVVAPEWAFVLGRVVRPGFCHGVLVVDIQHEDWPLWLIRFFIPDENYIWPQPESITLIGAKFPGSFSEWEQTLPATMPGQTHWRCLENTGLRVERCKFP